MSLYGDEASVCWLIRVGRFQWFSGLSKLAFESGRGNHRQQIPRTGPGVVPSHRRPRRVGWQARPHGRLLLTFDEAAEILGIGRTSLYRLVWAGRLTPVRIGRSVRFSRAQLEVFVSSLESGAC